MKDSEIAQKVQASIDGILAGTLVGVAVPFKLPGKFLLGAVAGALAFGVSHANSTLFRDLIAKEGAKNPIEQDKERSSELSYTR